MNHGRISNSDNLAYTGVSNPLIIDVQIPPENLPGFSESWVALQKVQISRRFYKYYYNDKEY